MQMAARFGLGYVPVSVLFALVLFITRPAVRAYNVERTVRLGGALGIEFQRRVIVRIIDQAYEIPGDHPSVIYNDDLSALALVVRQKAGSRQAGRRCTGDPAHVFGFPVIGIPNLAEKLALHGPTIGVPGQRRVSVDRNNGDAQSDDESMTAKLISTNAEHFRSWLRHRDNLADIS